MSELLFHEASQALFFLCIVGMIAAGIRFHHAMRRDLLLSFGIYLLGSAMREAVVYHYGGIGWDDTAMLVSGSARVVQLVGVLLFIRAAVREHCPPWVFAALLVIVALLVVAA
jgi:hypothetical protein